MTMRDFRPTHFNWRVDERVAVISLARPERKNPLTFESYAELRDAFRALPGADDIKAVVVASNGGNCAVTLRKAPCSDSDRARLRAAAFAIAASSLDTR